MGQIHAAHDKKFQRVIKHGRIGARGVYHGQHLVEHAVKMLGFHIFLSRQHLVRISLDGVDLPVVHDKTVGMGPLPAGISVGGEAGMNHGNGGLEILILQIPEKGPQLSHQKHALIYNRPAG